MVLVGCTLLLVFYTVHRMFGLGLGPAVGDCGFVRACPAELVIVLDGISAVNEERG